MATVNDLTNLFPAVEEKLARLDNDFPAQVEDFRQQLKIFQDAVSKKQEEGRVLSISIVGRVKSGKSTLLNALLFDGESVLPQAATPMTAALTFIRYADKCRAEVQFFSKDEWATFQEQAKKFDEFCLRARQEIEQEQRDAAERAKKKFQIYRPREITQTIIRDKVKQYLDITTYDIYEAAKEQVTMASKVSNSLPSFLGTTQTVISDVETTAELTGKLQDYVGANGRYTPFVCSTTVYFNDDRMKGYEIIDTPGTNDPIISRGKKTTDSLAKTDVVLVISPAGRFVDSSDLILLSQNLPLSGIKRFELIASQYDLAVRGNENKINKQLEPFDRLIEGMKMVQHELSDSFRSRIEEIISTAQKNNNADREKWERLAKAEPQCVSALAFILAKRWDRLNQEEQEYLDIFNEMIPGYQFDRETLEHFSFIDQVQERLDEVKSDKDKIIREALGALLDAHREKFTRASADFLTDINKRIFTLENVDVGQLQTALKEQTMRLQKGRASLEGVFEEAIFSAKTKFQSIFSEIRKAKADYARLNVQTESHTVTKEYQHDKGHGILFWRDITGTRYETRTRSYTVTTYYADAYEAVDQVEEFALRSRGELEGAIGSAVNVDALKNNVSDLVLDMFKDADMDTLELLKEQLKSTIRKITIPDADFGDVDYTTMITSKFSGSRIEGSSAIDELKAAQRNALNAVISDLEEKGKEKARQIEKSLHSAMDNFVNTLIADLRENTEKLTRDLDDKKNALSRLKACVKPATELKDIWN